MVSDPGFDSNPEPIDNSNIKKEKMYTNVYKHNGIFQDGNNRDSNTLNIQNNSNASIDDFILSTIKNNLSREGRYGVICFRASMRAKYMWDSLGIEHKRVLRDAFENIILGYGVQYQKQQIVNVNVNINVNKVENKAGGDAGALAEIAELVSKLYSLRNTLPPLQRQLVEELYSRVKKAVLS